MSNSPHVFASQVALRGADRSLSPFTAGSGETPRKGVASASSLAGSRLEERRVPQQLPPTVADADGGDDALRLQVIEQLQLTLDGNESRESIAERAGFSIRQIGAWTSPSSGKNISLANAVQIVRATGSLRLLSWAAAACGMHLVNDDVVRDAAVGKKVREAMRAVLEVA